MTIKYLNYVSKLAIIINYDKKQYELSTNCYMEKQTDYTTEIRVQANLDITSLLNECDKNNYKNINEVK